MATRKRVLVVDDDDDFRELVCLTLEDEGYEVVPVADGAAALSALPGLQPDVILLDLRMPVMDGHEFLRHYRSSCGAQAPVVVLTAIRETQDDIALLSPDAFLPKPFDLEDLVRTVQRLAPPAFSLGPDLPSYVPEAVPLEDGPDC
jgi:CheY-like chemotaxis protein